MGPFYALMCAQLVQPLLAGFALPDPGLPIFPDRFSFQDTASTRRPNRPPGYPIVNAPTESSTVSTTTTTPSVPVTQPATTTPSVPVTEPVTTTSSVPVTEPTTTTSSVPVTEPTTTTSTDPVAETTTASEPVEPEETTIENAFISSGGMPIVCYYDGWAPTRKSPMNYNIEDIPGDMCTHVNLAYVGIDQDKSDIKSLIPAYKDNPGLYKEFTALKNKFLILETMISIGGWNHGGRPFSFVAADASRRQTFADNVLKFLQENNLNGVDLDWRFPVRDSRGGDPDDEENYVHLLRVFHNTLRTKGYTVTATVPISPYYLDDGYDIGEMVKYIDWFNVLSFDLRGRWDGKADVHSPLRRRSIDPNGYDTLNVEDGLKWLEKLGAPREKLVVGIPFYGRSYVLANASNHALGAQCTQAPAIRGPFLGSDEIQTYYEICVKVLDGTVTKEFDNEGMCPYAYYDDQWIGYEDEESVGIKVDFIIKENYAGVMIFNNDMDDFRGVCGVKNALLKVVFEKVVDAP
ncbi:endochitinase-like isoform X2 [Ornithodoros turicata]|uniref:endochitinase-like isoform X2 n=1 Tax=Ornithodoros turicata TaxID=34597 RepID=UPI003139BD5E